MKRFATFGTFLLGTLILAACQVAPPPDGGGEIGLQHFEGLQLGPIIDDGHDDHVHREDGLRDPDRALANRDAVVSALEAAGVVSGGPSAKVTKNLALVSTGERNDANATTDVWAHAGYAYTGTFNTPCGGDPEAGVWVWDVRNKNRAQFVGIIESPSGSRSNDVRVATMNSGDVLVHSNEACAGGPGGFEIYDVDDPRSPVHLASVTPIDELNPISDNLFGGITDVGVHNLFLFTQGTSDYVAVTAESAFHNFRIYDITDPTNPVMASAWGAEELFDPGVGDETSDVGRVLDAALWLLDGFGNSANRFLHDVTITTDGTRAYLANWDAGLVLLDISDVTNPTVVSVALDPDNGSLDGEVNSHSVWPSEDGRIVVEGEEDFAPFETTFSITSGPAADDYPATEGAITTPIASLPGGEMSGPTVYVGLACDGAPIPSAPAPDAIALIQRGVCSFTSKINNAETAGYAGVVVFNDEGRGDALVAMGGDPAGLPGVFVGHSTGLAIAGVTDAGLLAVGADGENVLAAVVPIGWGGLRIWDYSDPANPVLASTFDTVCSKTVIDPSCSPLGTYSVHNVLVESTDEKVLAYVSWYSDGMLILDVTDPYNPVEVARYDDGSFGAAGTDYWGVYKVPGEPWIYGSDRNGGLDIFQAKGSGSGKK